MNIFPVRKSQPSLVFIAFLQAVGLAAYCSLIGLIIGSGDRIFGSLGSPLGPVLFLLLFVVSAIISALIVLGYPFLLFWEEKKTREALKLVLFTTFWLTFLVLLLILSLLFFKL